MLGSEFVNLAGGDKPPLVDYRDGVAQSFDQVKLMTREHHRHAAVDLSPQDAAEDVDSNRIETRKRLVQNREFGIVNQRAGELNPLLITERETLDPVTGPILQSQLIDPAVRSVRDSLPSMPLSWAR